MGKKTKQTAPTKKKSKLEKTVGKKRTEHTVQARSALLREATNAVQSAAPGLLMSYTKADLQLVTAVAGILTLFRGRSTVTGQDMKRASGFLHVIGVQ